MSQSEAADIIANATVVWARSHGLMSVRTPNKELVEARISELRATAQLGTYMHTAAVNANWRTTLRLLKERWT